MATLRALLVDVGGTPVNGATWTTGDADRRLRLRRLTEALGEERPVAHAFQEGSPTGQEQRTAQTVAAFPAEARRHSRRGGGRAIAGRTPR